MIKFIKLKSGHYAKATWLSTEKRWHITHITPSGELPGSYFSDQVIAKYEETKEPTSQQILNAGW